MASWDRRIVVIGRLRAQPLLAGQIGCAVLLAGTLASRIEVDARWGDIGHIMFGDPLVTVLIVAAAFGWTLFFRLWRQRASYIFHDGARLYRGSDRSWSLETIRDVIITRSGVGMAALRLVVDDDSETTRELVKLPLLADRPEVVREAVLFAAAGVRGMPVGMTVN